MQVRINAYSVIRFACTEQDVDTLFQLQSAQIEKESLLDLPGTDSCLIESHLDDNIVSSWKLIRQFLITREFVIKEVSPSSVNHNLLFLLLLWFLKLVTLRSPLLKINYKPYI